MSQENLITLCILVGIALPLIGWTVFRKPGVPFAQFAPATRVHEYLQPVGVLLWWMGIVVALAGVFMRWS
ncbi:MAG: hypothetical protein REI94_19620 [Moraxellaceae bacterium]|nr:hypothetical protein [Moraxellaceae bacterium]